VEAGERLWNGLCAKCRPAFRLPLCPLFYCPRVCAQAAEYKAQAEALRGELTTARSQLAEATTGRQAAEQALRERDRRLADAAAEAASAQRHATIEQKARWRA